MSLTERRAMLYLPENLYRRSVLMARQQKKSLAAFVREALAHHLQSPAKSNYKEAMSKSFGIWKNKRLSGIGYENKIRKTWSK